MTLLILDPDLTGPEDASAQEALAIAAEAAGRGQNVVVLGSRTFAGAAPDGIRILPFFAHGSAAALHDDPVTGRFDDFSTLNDALARDLARIPRTETRATDAVYVPHAGVNQLVGFASWMKSFPALDAPLFFIRLAGPRAGEGRQPVDDALGALFLRLGFRAADAAGPPIRFLAAGRALAKDWTARSGRAVAPMPAPFAPHPPAALAPRRACVLAPPGAAVEPLLRTLAGQHPDWTFIPCGDTPGPAGDGPPNLAPAEGPALPADLALLLVLPWAGEEPARPLWEALSLGVPMLLPRTGWMAREAALWGEFLGAYPATASAEQTARHVSGAINRLDELSETSAAIATRFRAANGPAALMDWMGGLWAARIAAAALLVRERETAIPLAGLYCEGWHKLEDEAGQPLRWTTAAPEIAFDWPFLVPWQLRLHLRAFHGDDQLKGITATCEGEALAVAIVHDAAGAVIRIDGRPGDPRAPHRLVRIRLPSTHRPPDDPRDLGVFVSAITLRALPAPLSEGPPALPAAAVLAAPDADGTWPIHGVLAGEIVADATDAAGLFLRLDIPGGPPVARAMALYLNGAPVGLEIAPGQGGEWTARAALPMGVLRAGGLVGAWDLVLTGPARLLECTAIRLAGTQAPAPRRDAPAEPSEPAGPARRGKWWRGGG